MHGSSDRVVMPILGGVSPEAADRFWPQVMAWVEAAAADTGSWTADDWLGRIKARDAQLWIVWLGGEITGVVITELYNTASGSTCGIPIAGGVRLEESLPVLRVIEDWAREHECVRLESTGRNGWVRALRNEGWRPVSMHIEKRIA
jgi:hypothetical protein